MKLSTWQKNRKHYICLINEGKEIPNDIMILYDLDTYIEEYEGRTDRIMREWSSVDFE